MTAADSGPAESVFAKVSLLNPWLFTAAILVSVIPLWIGDYPPLVDLPQHAAQITAMKGVLVGDPLFASVFELNFFTPYLLAYLLLFLFSLVLPIAIASKLLVTLALAATPFATGRLLCEAGADERWKWLTIPCAFSFAFYWGFLSFLVAVPLALVFLTQSIRFCRTPTLSGALSIAAFSVFMFFSHIIALGVASLISLGYIVGSHRGGINALLVKVVPYTTPLPLIAVWMWITYTSLPTVQNDPILFDSVLNRFLALWQQPSGLEEPSIVMLLITTGVVAIPPLTGATLSRRPERWLPFGLALLAFLVAPRYVFSTAYFYQRLGVFLVPLGLLVWDKSTNGRRFDWLVPGLIAIWMIANTWRFVMFARDSGEFKDIVAHMQPGRTVAAMMVENDAPAFAYPVYLHFPLWYQAERGGIVDFNFADFYSQVARYRTDAPHRMTDLLSWYPTLFEWSKDGGERYDYFVVRSRIDASTEIFKNDRSRVRFVHRSGPWWLYENGSRLASRPTRSAAD